MSVRAVRQGPFGRVDPPVPVAPPVRLVADARLPTRHGDFRCRAYASVANGVEHLALVRGDVRGRRDVLVRLHSECLTGDVFGSMRCDCGPQLDSAMARIVESGFGVIVYLRGHEGRGIGLAHKLQAYELQEQGRDTVDANLDLGLPVDGRAYDVGASILDDLGVAGVRLLTNNPGKWVGLEAAGTEVVERVPLQTVPNPENVAYLRTKRERLGHLLDGLDGTPVAGPPVAGPPVAGSPVDVPPAIRPSGD